MPREYQCIVQSYNGQITSFCRRSMNQQCAVTYTGLGSIISGMHSTTGSGFYPPRSVVNGECSFHIIINRYLLSFRVFIYYKLHRYIHVTLAVLYTTPADLANQCKGKRNNITIGQVSPILQRNRRDSPLCYDGAINYYQLS